MAWTDEQVELLRTLWKEGLSASQIAARLQGGVSRNAVIGKVHRLGLASRPRAAPKETPSSLRAKEKVRVRKKVTLFARLEAPPSSPTLTDLSSEASLFVRNDIPSCEHDHVSLLDLRDSMCRWPLGDPAKSDFRFCGAPSLSPCSYCAKHARMAYQPSHDRRRERKVGKDVMLELIQPSLFVKKKVSPATA